MQHISNGLYHVTYRSPSKMDILIEMGGGGGGECNFIIDYFEGKVFVTLDINKLLLHASKHNACMLLNVI